jgi:hypothetical protein
MAGPAATGGCAAPVLGAAAPVLAAASSTRRLDRARLRLDSQNGQTARSAYAGMVTGAPHCGHVVVSMVLPADSDILLIYRRDRH